MNARSIYQTTRTRLFVGAALFVFLFAIVGCHNYYTEEVQGNLVEKRFDDRVTGGIATAFNECMAPLTLQSGMKSLALTPLDKCDASSVDASTLGIVMATHDQKIQFPQQLPDKIVADSWTYDLPQPAPGCDFEVEYEARFQDASIESVDSEWGVWTPSPIDLFRSRSPELIVSAEIGSEKVGEVDISTAVDCSDASFFPKAKKNNIQFATLEMRNALNGTHDVRVEGMTVAMSIRILKMKKLFGESDAIVSKPSVHVDLDELKLDIDWSRATKIGLPSTPAQKKVFDRSDLEDPAEKALVDEIASNLSRAVTDVSNQVEGRINGAIDSGYAVCDVRAETFDGQLNLVIVTDDPSDQHGKCEATQPEKKEQRVVSVEYNYNRGGSDYRNFALERAEPERCRQACAEEDKCGAFTYVPPGRQGRKARCWLKDSVPNRTKDEGGLVSGVKGDASILKVSIEYGYNRGGSDYSDFNLSAPDPELCREACADDSKCKAYTYVPPGHQAPSARCWLKDSVPNRARDKAGLVSGVKGSYDQ